MEMEIECSADTLGYIKTLPKNQRQVRRCSKAKTGTTGGRKQEKDVSQCLQKKISSPK